MLVLLLVMSGTPSALADSDPGRAGLAVLNELRSVSGLAPVAHDATMERGALDHARYMVRTNTIGHSQDPHSRWFSDAGHQAAQESNLALLYDAEVEDHVGGLHAVPFHQLGQMRPGLRRSVVAYWSDGPLSGGVVNVIGGLDRSVLTTTPIAYPGPGSTSPLRRASGEWPDPLTACPGYTEPTGASIMVLLPTSETATAVRLRRGSQQLEACVFDGSTYTNPDRVQHDLGRRLLARENAVTVIPRDPLRDGSYAVSIDLDGAGTLAWSFEVGAQPRAASGGFRGTYQGLAAPMPDHRADRDLAAACPPELVPPARFADTRTSLYADDIDCAVSWGVVTGRTDTRFEPDRTVTRAQLASMIDRWTTAAGRPLPAEGAARFRDVSQDSVHADTVGRAAAAGIVQGRTDGTFAPAGQVSRAQAASMLARAYRWVVGEDPFANAGWTLRDVSEGSAHHTAVLAMVSMGAMPPDPSLGWGRFRPQAAATRAQLASHLMALADRAASRTGDGHPANAGVDATGSTRG
ncbi:MAG: S-layer homology domain-containing protein [Nitriliruptoraceae bacterium]